MKMLSKLCNLVVVSLVLQCSVSSAFSLPTQSRKASALPGFSFLQDVFNADKSMDKERQELKDQLLEECSQSKPSRESIEGIIEKMKEYSPVQATAASDLLQKKWALIWTTEKEINFFLDRGLSDSITQTIDGSRLENCIPFKKGGEFGVSGTLSIPDPHGVRTEFEFKTATLDLGWLKLNLPPVGKGWFDTIYLDQELRVDTNSRDDILICRPEEK